LPGLAAGASIHGLAARVFRPCSAPLRRACLHTLTVADDGYPWPARLSQGRYRHCADSEIIPGARSIAAELAERGADGRRPEERNPCGTVNG
jgi:hypothetical protein